MDFEEQLEKAEKLSSPSLVGSSLRSADDSPHNNYIHPEKYKKKQGYKKDKNQGAGILNLSLAASLDDLIREGALLGSEEDFDEMLDDTGNIKDDARYLNKDSKNGKKGAEKLSPLLAEVKEDKEEKRTPAARVIEELKAAEDDQISGSDKKADKKDKKDKKATGTKTAAKLVVSNASSSMYQQDTYSNPNLSEYQLDHQIKDHNDLLTNIQSYDPHRLPSSQSNYKGTNGNDAFKRPVSPSKKAVDRTEDAGDSHRTSSIDGMHTPYFQRHSRSTSRSAVTRGDRSRSRSQATPHLARGDSYKNTHSNEPSKYELPPDFAASELNDEEVEEEDSLQQERRSRQSKPTMGESIAAAEASKTKQSEAEAVPEITERDPSLVTTGDYTNFDVDRPEPTVDSSANLYATRSQSSTNYLRSISRSRSRQAADPERTATLLSEKNDADPGELVREGALVTDDPYSTIGGLDTMVEEVLNPAQEELDSSLSKDSKDENTDISSKETKTKAIDSLEESKAGDTEAETEINKSADGSLLTNKEQAKSIVVEDKEPENSELNENKKADKESIKKAEEFISPKDAEIDSAILEDDKSADKSGSKESSESNKKEKELGTKEISSEIDDTAAEQIEASVGEKDEALDKAESLTAKDINGDSTEQSSSTDIHNEEIKPTTKKDIEDKAAEQIESSVDEKDKILDNAKSLTSKDIHAKSVAKDKEAKDNDSESTTRNDVDSTSTAAKKAVSSLGGKEKVVKSEPSTSKEITEDATKENDSTPETKPTTKKDIDDKAAEKIESSIGGKDEALDKAESLTAKDISGDSSEKSSSTEIHNEEIKPTTKKDVEDKAAEQIESNAEEKDKALDQAKPLTAEDIKSPSEPAAEEKDSKLTESKDVKNEATKTSGTNESDSTKTTKDTAIEEAEPATTKDLNVASIVFGKKDEATKDAEPASLKDVKASDTSANTAETVTTKDLNAASIASGKKDEIKKVAEPATSKEIKSSAVGATAENDDLSDIDVTPEELRKHLESQPVFIFTSLAGGMQIMTKTNRLTTILQANGVKFAYRDLGTDEEAKKIWRRQANGKTLPGVVRGDDLIGNWQEIDEANEEYKLHELLYETI